MNIFDPVTGVKLTVFCYETSDGEIYRCNEEKAVQTIMREKTLDRNEAIRLLSNSDGENPVVCSDSGFWVE